MRIRFQFVVLVSFFIFILAAAPVEAAKKKKTKKKKNTGASPSTEAAGSARPATTENVTLSPEEACDACQVVIDGYAEKLRSLTDDPMLSRAGPDQKQLDGNAVAEMLCDELAVPYR